MMMSMLHPCRSFRALGPPPPPPGTRDVRKRVERDEWEPDFGVEIICGIQLIGISRVVLKD